MITAKFTKPIPNKIPKCITRVKGITKYHYIFFNDEEKTKESIEKLYKAIQK